MCSVDYDNYSGDLSEAPAEPLADDPDYLFVTRPEGTFFSKTHSFEILLGEEDMHIAWADTCEYDLYRSDALPKNWKMRRSLSKTVKAIKL